MSLIRRSRLEPESWMTCADSTSSASRCCCAFSASSLDRISRLLSGVRSSWDMLARKSVLYWLARASACALSSVSRCRSSSTCFCSLRISLFCRSSSLEACNSSACTRSSSSDAARRWVCSSSSTVFCCSSSLVARSSSCMRSFSSDCSSASAWARVFSSSSRVCSARRMLSRPNAAVGSNSSTKPSVAAPMAPKVPNSNTPSKRSCSSKGTAITWRGAASPVAEWIAKKASGTRSSTMRLRYSAHWPIRPSPSA